MAKGKLLPFSSRKPQVKRLQLAFRVIRAFVARAWLPARFVRLQVGCPEIEAFRASHPGPVGARSLMHMGHKQGTICALATCERLPEGFLAGLFLHEFGHLGSGGGELEADRWVLDTFGIRIYYKTELDLECIDQFSMIRIARSLRMVDVDLRHNPPPRQSSPDIPRLTLNPFRP